MLLTPDDARKKTCPFITYCLNERAVVTDGAGPIVSHSSCHADACMAWRWGDREETQFFVKKNDGPEERWSWNPQNQKGYEEYTCRVVFGVRKGFCGIAGVAR